MIVDLKKVASRPQAYRFTLEREWWLREAGRDEDLSLLEPLEVRIRLHKAGDRFVLEGRLRGLLGMDCDRCLEAYGLVLDAPFRVFFALPPNEQGKTDAEILDEEVEVEVIRDEEVELDGIIREQIYLTLPIKRLCSDRCRGLCPSCGGNLNRGECRCRDEHRGHPAFARLKTLIRRED